MTKFVFLDTETTDLPKETREVWEFGGVVREPGAADREFEILVEDVSFASANPQSLKIGRAYERHPRFNSDLVRPGKGDTGQWLIEVDAAAEMERITRDAVIVGIVPDFDSYGVETVLFRHGLPYSGYYHLLDVETLVAGYLTGQRSAGRDVPDLGLPPWSSDEVSRLVGVEPPGELDRHTALGDARWARDLWDVVMGS